MDEQTRELMFSSRSDEADISKMKLFIITQLSELVMLELIKHTDVMVVTTEPHIAQELWDKLSIEAQVLSVESRLTPKENDELFYKEFMPGRLKGLKLDDFPLWESLSIDRLRFWFGKDSASILADLVSNISFDELFISADLYSPLPWAVAGMTNTPVTAIKTHTLRTSEFYNFYPRMPINKMIVSFYDERELLLGICKEKEVLAKAGARPKREAISNDKRKSLKESLAVPEGLRVAGVAYDKRDEWQFTNLLKMIIDKPISLLVFPYDSRSQELFYKCVPKELRSRVSIGMMDDLRFLGVCDEFVMFRFLEDVYQQLPDIPVAIYDFHNLNKSKEVAIDSQVFT